MSNLNLKTIVASVEKQYKISEVNSKLNLEDICTLQVLNKCKNFLECLYNAGNLEYEKDLNSINNKIKLLIGKSSEICSFRTINYNNNIFKSTNNI